MIQIVKSDLKRFQFNCEEDVEEKDKEYEKAKFLEVRRFSSCPSSIRDRDYGHQPATQVYSCMRQTKALALAFFSLRFFWFLVLFFFVFFEGGKNNTAKNMCQGREFIHLHCLGHNLTLDLTLTLNDYTLAYMYFFSTIRLWCMVI